MAVVTALQKGSFGECPNEIEDYKKKCLKLFPYCVMFMPSDGVVENGPDCSEASKCNGNADCLVEADP